jgi:hypothetical protein
MELPHEWPAGQAEHGLHIKRSLPTWSSLVSASRYALVKTLRPFPSARSTERAAFIPILGSAREGVNP